VEENVHEPFPLNANGIAVQRTLHGQGVQGLRRCVVVVGEDGDFEVLVAQDRSFPVQGRGARVEEFGVTACVAGGVLAGDWVGVEWGVAGSGPWVRGLEGADEDGEGEGRGCEVGGEGFVADLEVCLGEGVEAEVV
jgi:hypothetical protein